MDNTPPSAPYQAGYPADPYSQPSEPEQQPVSAPTRNDDQPWRGLSEPTVVGEVVEGEVTGSAAAGEIIRAEVLSIGMDGPTQALASSPTVDTGDMPYAGSGYPHAPGVNATESPAATPPPAPAPLGGLGARLAASSELATSSEPTASLEPTAPLQPTAPSQLMASSEPTAPSQPWAAEYTPSQYMPAPQNPVPTQYGPPGQYPAAPYSAPPYSAPPYSASPYAPAPYQPMVYPTAGSQQYGATPVTSPPWSPPGQPAPWSGTPVGPGGPLAPYPGYPPPYYLPEPPRRKRRGLILAAVIAGVVVLALCAGLVGYGFPKVLGPGHATASAKASGPVTSTPTLPADATDDEIVQATLDAQSAALLRGDETGWLAPVDPDTSTAVAAYKRLYNNLTQLHVKAWKASSTSLVDLSSSGTHTFTMSVAYCFNSTSCDGVRANMKVTAVKRNGKAIFEGLAAPKASALSNQPLPWEVSTLTAVVGSRVVLAASSEWASRLPKVLPIAEAAAAAADKYAKWGLPTNYVIYLANTSEGKTWFNGGLKNADGVSYTLSPRDIQMVIMMPYATETAYAGPGGINTVIQHEMGHVVTLWSMTNRGVDHDDFIEGVAEYIAYTGHTSWAKYRIYDTRAYVRSGKWNKKCYMTDQIVSSNVLTSSAAYGIGYLTMRYLASKYGQDKMLTFWGSFERDGLSLDAAAKQTFGTSWTSVNSGCVTYVRNAVGA